MSQKQPKFIRIVRDNREQDGFDFKADLDFGRGYNAAPEVIDGTIRTGDYSLPGFRERVTVERKNPNDLVQSLTDDRERFKAELERMAEMDSPLIVIEAPESYFMAGHHGTGADGNAIIQSMRSICAEYRLPYQFCAGKEEAQQRTYDHLRHYWEHRRKGRRPYIEKALMRAWAEVQEAAT